MDGLRLMGGIAAPGFAVGVDSRGHHHHPPAKVSAGGPRVAGSGGNAVETTAMPTQQSYLFPRPLRRLWPGGGGGGGLEVGREEVVVVEKTGGREEAEEEEEANRRSVNWVLNILRVRSLWAEEGEGGRGVEEREEEEVKVVDGDDPAVAAVEEGDRCVGCGAADDSEGGCVVGEGNEEPMVFDRESFSRLLRKVSLAEVELYAKMSYLGSLAYIIPKIKPKNLLKFHGLQFVTSSLEKRGRSSGSDKDQMPSKEETYEGEEDRKQQENGSGISASAAYQIAASAASYLQSQTMGILPFRSKKAARGKDSTEGGRENEVSRIASSEEASFVATTNSVTAMVAGKEEMKEAVAKDLNSLQSSPCEWFICDDDSSGTRYFTIQGSESLASWQANLLFEPIQFEGLDVLVHRGIYEVAKGIYQQMLPEIQSHLKSHGNSATLQFTGHSLGGSLALLVNLMLLIRGEAPASSLLPVITFGAPFIMCGGDYLLQKLGLPKSHVQAVTMHRDIVPRAFSCNYPDHVAKILKAISGNFRNHPCLKNQKMLYAPMGKLLILQPEETFSPYHHLLPPGSGLYLLGNSLLDSDDPARLLQAAQSAFLNTPHPLEILSDRSAYGSEGTIYRDHDMNSYIRSVRGVIRQELKLIRKAKREQRRHVWWPLVTTQDLHASIVTGQCAGPSNSPKHNFSFAGVFHGGRERLKQLGRLVASRHVQMLVVLLFPARLLLLGTLSIANFR